MEGDLKDQIGQVLSPDIARQLASTVGLDDGQGKTFVDAAVPTLLTALGSLDGPGAKALSDAVSNADPNLIERLRRALNARDLTPLTAGANALVPVIGGGARDKIANALADHLGVPSDATIPALGAVEQAVVAVLGQQDPAVWSDGEALRSYLSGQKAAFSAAVPGALAASIAPAAVAPAAPVVVAPAAPPPRPTPAAPTRAAPPPPPQPASGGGMTWIVVLILIVIVAAGGWYYWTQMRPETKTGSNTPDRRVAIIGGANGPTSIN